MGEKNKKGQSEIIGFGIIVIIVAVIILVVISVSINKSSNNVVKSYETETFLQSMVQYTTNCTQNSHHLSYLDLVTLCGTKGLCGNGPDACEVLNQTSNNLINSAWKYGPDYPLKGYQFSVMYQNNTLVGFERGNQTAQQKGSQQDIGAVQIRFVAHY